MIGSAIFVPGKCFPDRLSIEHRKHLLLLLLLRLRLLIGNWVKKSTARYILFVQLTALVCLLSAAPKSTNEIASDDKEATFQEQKWH